MSLIEEVQAARTKEREEATALYREILHRNDSPAEGDARELSRLLTVLDVSPAQLAEDLAALEQAAAFALQLDDAAAAQQAAHDAREAQQTAAAKRETIITELNAEGKRLEGAVDAADGRLQGVNLARKGLKDMVRGNRRLFGDEYSDLIS